jgi:hypothetical protein
MSQVVQAKCPFCRNVLRIPADWLARPMRCKFCQQVIQAKESSHGAGATATMNAAGAAAPDSAESATAVVAGPPRRASGDPFSFDDEPEPAPVTAPRRKKQGKGAIIAGVLLAAFTTVAVLVAVFAGPQLRKLFRGEEIVEIVENGGQDKPVQNGDKAVASDKNPPNTDGGGAPKTNKGSGGIVKGKSTELFPRRALLINVNNYWVLNPVHYGSARAAGYPGSSTAVMAQRLSDAPMYFPATQVVELSDTGVNPIIPQKGVIQDAISEFCNTSREQDRIVILFAGHAVEIEKEAYLIPYEGSQNDAKMLIPLSWVYDKLAKCKARQKILILDAFRFPPGRGFELPGTGAMSEEFDAKLQNPPPGVQVWTACVKEQQSIEYDNGSLFLQCVCDAMKDRLGGFASPDESIPVEALAAKVSQRIKDLLSKTKFAQTARLSGKEAEGGAAYNSAEPLPPQVVLKPPMPALNDDQAGAAAVNNILSEIKQIPPMKESLKAYMSTLKAEALPPFSKKIMDFYRADYKSWSELEGKLKDKSFREKFPLRAAVLDAKKALDAAEGVQLQVLLFGPINEKTKASFADKQKPIGMAIFELEEAWATMKEAAEKRDKEDSKRWQANFDYTLARLQSRLVYMNEYDYILADIRADRLPTLEGDNTLWRLGFKQKVSTNENKVKNMVKDISKLWKKIEDEHPNTPWALLAQREKLYAMGLEWRASRL